MGRIDIGFVKLFDEPEMNQCLYGFCASSEFNKCKANRAPHYMSVFGRN